MEVEELRKLLKNSKDKFSILTDKSILAKYKIENGNLFGLINDFLNDEEKLKILHDPNFISEHELIAYQIVKIIETLSEENKEQLLKDREYIDGLELKNYHISGLTAGLESDEVKEELIDLYEFHISQVMDIVTTFQDEKKFETLKQDKYQFEKEKIPMVLSSMGANKIISLYKEEKEFFEKNEMNLYKIVKMFRNEEQLEFIEKMEQLELDISERRKILVSLNEKVKGEIDTSKFPKEYITALTMKVGKPFSKDGLSGKIIVDFKKRLEIYKGLDELITIYPMKVLPKNKDKLLKLCELCPNIVIQDELGLTPSVGSEYKNGEIWIDSVLSRNKRRLVRYSKNSIYR
ncbi:MAG: hypothetical protein LBL91_00890 [Lachnospiraceae bacterium]|nr:hypothetical protein [Lachnospiraceae bacterium]